MPMTEIYLTPLDGQGKPIIELTTPVPATAADFTFDDVKNEKVNWPPTETSLEIPVETNPRLMELLLGPAAYEPPTWEVELGGHRMLVWNLRKGERGPDGKIPYEFDGRFLCGPHDADLNHVDASRDQK